MQDQVSLTLHLRNLLVQDQVSLVKMKFGKKASCNNYIVNEFNLERDHGQARFITPRAYAQAGLSNRFCPSVVVVVCHTKILKKP